MAFDGVDGFLFVEMGVIEGKNVGNFGTRDFTISFWMKTTTDRFEGIMGKRQFCGAHSFWDLRLSTDLSVEFYHDANPDNRNNISGLRILNDGIWHQVVLTRQGTTVTLYVDGRLEQQRTKEPVVHILNLADFEIGRSRCWVTGSTFYFTGMLE